MKNALFASKDTDIFDRNKTLSFARLSKELYYHPYCTKQMNNMKATWVGSNQVHLTLCLGTCMGSTVGAVDASHLCDPGSIPVLAVSCGLSFLLVLALLQGFSSGISDFPPSTNTKTTTSKFQFDLDVRASIDNSPRD